ncbi:MAG: TlpA family protein disulfide reductase [Thermoanaerobaculia bacterium]|nr:TlpA family protein disulfide reductase [Thermoanaerobaculia bacterium]
MSDTESQPVNRPSSVKRGLVWSTHLVFCFVLALSAFVLFWPKPDPDQAPSGELVDSAGEEVDLEERMAGVTLVHFWATWCPPCIAEVPSIRRLAADHANADFSLIMVAVADDVKKATEFLGDGETLFDPAWDLAHDYGTTKLPETHLVVDGKVLESFIGATDWDREDVRRKVQAALDGV